MKYSEVVGKNFFEMPSKLPGVNLMYYLDYQANGKSRAAFLLQKNGVRKLVKDFIPCDDSTFALIGVYIKSSDVRMFEESMRELENTAPLFCDGYKEARIRVLDDIVVMKASET